MVNLPVKVVENPISHKMLVILEYGDMRDLAREAAAVANRCPNHVVEAGMDYGATTVVMTPEERSGKTVTAADFYEKLLAARGMTHGTDSDMFEVTAEGPGNVLQAEFKKDGYLDHVTIYDAALEAARLSKAHGKAAALLKARSTPDPAITFEFRGRTISVTGTEDPGAIEQSFSQNQRQRTDPVEPPRIFQSVKDRFNVTAREDGISAVYKDPTAAQKHVYYIASDLADLSHEFNDCKVLYNHAGTTLTVTSADRPQDIEKRVPQNARWLASSS